MDDKIRTIHTGLYGKTARTLLPHLFGRIYSLYACKARTWKNRSTVAARLVITDDNEAILQFEKVYDRRGYEYYRAFKDWSDKQVLDHFAWLIKDISKSAIFASGCGAEWKRNETKEVTISARCWNARMQTWKEATDLKARVCDIYVIYDYFKGRKLRLPKAELDNFISHPLDPISTEMKIAQREEIKHIEDALRETIRKLERERYEEQDRVQKVVWVKYEGLIAAARKETAVKIKEIEDMLDQPIAAAALLVDAELGA